MRWLLCLFLLSCSGGGGAPETVAPSAIPPAKVPPSAAYDLRDFWPARASRVASGWTSTVTSPTTFTMAWPGTEDFHIAPNPADGGKLWLFLDAYTGPGIRYVSYADRTEINRGTGWQAATSTNFDTPYLPILIDKTETIQVRSWGWILINGNPARRWFHIQRVRFVPAVVNPCWQAGPPGNVLDTFQQEEAWYDDAQGWTDRGRGVNGPGGDPTGDNITYFYRNYVAQGPTGGPLWTGHNDTTGQDFCLFY